MFREVSLVDTLRYRFRKLDEALSARFPEEKSAGDERVARSKLSRKAALHFRSSCAPTLASRVRGETSDADDPRACSRRPWRPEIDPPLTKLKLGATEFHRLS